MMCLAVLALHAPDKLQNSSDASLHLVHARPGPVRLRLATPATFAIDPIWRSFMALLTTGGVGMIAVTVAVREISVARVLVSAQAAAA